MQVLSRPHHPENTCGFRKSPTEALSLDFLVLLARFPLGHIYVAQDRVFQFPAFRLCGLWGRAEALHLVITAFPSLGIDGEARISRLPLWRA